FNRLSGEAKDVGVGVFTTLSPTTRGMMVDHTKLLISDTVGFISRLPTYMIEAFKSTLEEVSYANLVLLLVDASEPEEKLLRNFESCTWTLSELGVPEGRTLVVMNEADLLTGEQLGEAEIVQQVRDVNESWGGSFEVTVGTPWRGVVAAARKDGRKVVHLTMYGLPLLERAGELRGFTKLLVVVGGPKVPGEMYHMADY